MSSFEKVVEFMWEWDPAGIGTLRHEIPSEYDDLARSVVMMLRGGHPSPHIVTFLTERLRNDWDVESVPDNVADKLSELDH